MRLAEPQRECKGAADTWSTNKVVKNLDTLGRKDVALKIDGELALVAVQTRVVNGRVGMTVPLNPPSYDPQADGVIEQGVQDWNAQLRALKLGNEACLVAWCPPSARPWNG